MSFYRTSEASRLCRRKLSGFSAAALLQTPFLLAVAAALRDGSCLGQGNNSGLEGSGHKIELTRLD